MTLRPIALSILTVAVAATAGGIASPGDAWAQAGAQKDAKKGAPNAPPPPVPLLILATSDEHGWLEPYVERGSTTYQGGMGYLMGQLTVKEGYSPKEMLLISAGDMWTGPFETTILQGRPMVQVMNAMAYDAATLGNHDFDFGQEVLQKRAAESSFPFISANLYKRGTKVAPPYARPYVMTEAAGIKIAIVGLTTTDTVYTTDARNLGGLQFGDYREALMREVPRARAAGAQVVVVAAHADLSEMVPLVKDFRGLGINQVVCGHRHHSRIQTDEGDPATKADDVSFCNPGAYGRSYCRFQAMFDSTTFELVGQQVSVEPVQGVQARPTYPPHDGLMLVAAEARSQATAKGAEVLGSLNAGLERKEPVHTMGYFVTDAWRDALPYADFAISNRGGFRQDIAAGPVAMRDLVGAMPFDNYLLVVKLSYEQLAETMEHPQSVASGLVADYAVDSLGKRTVKDLKDLKGQSLPRSKTYKVIVNDFMYRGGDRYRLKEFDPNPEETALHWRDPLVRMFRKAAATNKPLVVPTAARFHVLP